MRNYFAKIKDSAPACIIKDVLSWRYFTFIYALVIVSCYYLKADIVSIYFVALTGLLSVLFLDDLSPLISNFLFMNIMISYENSPSSIAGNSNYFENPVIYIQVFILIALYVGGIIYRIADTVLKGKFKATPTFYSLAVLAIVFLLNGTIVKKYDYMNFAYGVFMAFFFLCIFTILKDNIKFDEKTYLNIAYAFLALSAVLILELAVKYITCEDVYSNGVFNRSKLSFGWGMYNNMGMLMLLCVPSVIYIASKHKYGYAFYIYSFILVAAIALTLSRQAMLGTAAIFTACVIYLLIKGKNRKINIIITCVAAAGGIVCALACWDKFAEAVTYLFSKNNLQSGNGRIMLWKRALDNFKAHPLFGIGFFIDLVEDPGFAGLSVVPDMYHNTFFQLLASCGITGLLAYLYHRAQTIISFTKNVTPGRLYAAVTIVALLLLNLLDNHIFYMLPTLIYSFMTALLVASERENILPLKDKLPRFV